MGRQRLPHRCRTRMHIPNHERGAMKTRAKKSEDGRVGRSGGNEAELAVEVEIAASPSRVWEVLTDFRAYVEWHPYQTITGDAEAFGRIEVTSRRLGSDGVETRSTGIIMRFEPTIALEFVSGSPFFWGARRWFHLQATPKGTLLRHGTTFTGWLARRAFKTTHKISQLQPFFEAVSLALSRRATSPNWRKPTGGNRRSRRASKAQRRQDG